MIPLKVAIIDSYLSVVDLELCRTLMNVGIDAQIITSKRSHIQYRNTGIQFKDDSLRITTLDSLESPIMGLNLYFPFPVLHNLLSTLEKEAPEVVQTTEHVSSPSFWVNAKKGNWNSVLIERAGEWDGIVPRFKIHSALAKKLVIPKVDGFGALSSFAADILRGLGCKKEIASIPNPVDTDAFNVQVPWSERKNVVLYVGRLTRIKMVHILIAAMPIVHEKVPDAELWLIGDGDEEENYKRLAAGKSYIRFLGSKARGELSHYYNQARMLVMLSNKKMTGIGVATEEAMACGVPIVGSKGIPFDEDEHIFYSRTELTSEDFANNIIRCLSQGEKQSIAARVVAEKKYSYSAVGTNYKKMLNGMDRN